MNDNGINLQVRFEVDSLSGWSADTYIENKHRIWYFDFATHNNTIWSLFHPETTVQIPLILVSSSVSNQFYWCDLNPSTTHLLRGNNSEETLANLWLILMSSCITLWRRQRFIRTKRRGRTPRGLPAWPLKLAGDETRPTGAPKICVLYNAQGQQKSDDKRLYLKIENRVAALRFYQIMQYHRNPYLAEHTTHFVRPLTKNHVWDLIFKYDFELISFTIKIIEIHDQCDHFRRHFSFVCPSTPI